MKVCTDACVLGAWADINGAERILDIGSGTGLLALMVAQRNPLAKIDGVELDRSAYLQAVENVNESLFKAQISVLNSSIQQFSPTYKYDCIVTNPPFFQSDLLSPNDLKNAAHHAVTLSFDDLLHALDRLLTENGSFHILLPVEEALLFFKKATVLNWNLSRKLILHHNKLKNPFRQLMTFKRKDLIENQTIEENLYIYNAGSGSYTSEFKDLLKDFYLIF